jgi:hypothetical protein
MKRKRSGAKARTRKKEALVSGEEMRAFFKAFCRFDDEHAWAAEFAAQAACVGGNSLEDHVITDERAARAELALGDALRAVQHARLVAQGRATSAIGADGSNRDAVVAHLERESANALPSNVVQLFPEARS